MIQDILSELIIKKIYGTIRINAKAGALTRRKNRECWGIAVKINGRTEYHCEGETLFSDKNNIVVLPKNSSYTWTSSGGECLMIDFEADASCKKIFSFSIQDNFNIVSLLSQIEKNETADEPQNKIKNFISLYKIFVILIESCRKHYFPPKKKILIAPAVNYISENYTNPEINNKMLSQITGLSEVYFRKLFAELYKCPPMEYVQNLRMKKAAEMLSSDYDSIESIALSLGYGSVYHFSKMFKKRFGVSPSKYKNYMRLKNL